MRWMRWLLAAMTALTMGAISAPALAQPKGEVEEQVRARMLELLGTRPDSVRRTPYGLFEVVVGTEIYYTDQNAGFVFVGGRLIDAKTRQDVTEARREELLRVDYAKLPFDQAIRLRFGKGTRQFVTFEDPNCPFCRRLHEGLRGLKDATVYVFLYPILSADSFEKSRNIWCARDRAAAWNAAMLEGKTPPTASPDCKHPLEQNVQLGQRLGVRGTPTLIFQDGSRLPGAVPLADIEQRLAAVKR